MSDYQDYLLDPGVTVKEEPLLLETSIISASVPIPRRNNDLTDYRDITFDLETSQSSLNDLNYLNTYQMNQEVDESAMWSTRFDGDLDIKPDPSIQMDEDDIFQVDKADLIQGPTLAELNANDETLLGDLNFDDLLLPEENVYNIQMAPQMQKFPASLISSNFNSTQNFLASSYPLMAAGYYREPGDVVPCNSPNIFNHVKTPLPAFSPSSQISPSSQTGSNSPLLQAPSPIPSGLSAMQQKHSTLHELLMKREAYSSPDRSMLGTSVPGPSSPTVGTSVRMRQSHSSRLSSSAPTHLGLEQIWQRREPRKHLLSTGSLAEAGSTSSLSTGGVLSPEAQDFSHDEGDSDEDSDHYEDFSSDNGEF